MHVRDIITKIRSLDKDSELSPFLEGGKGLTVSRDRLVYQASKGKEYV